MSPQLDNLMMNYPLTLTHFFERTRRVFPRKTLATRVPGVGLERLDYGRWAERTTRLAAARAWSTAVARTRAAPATTSATLEEVRSVIGTPGGKTMPRQPQ